jgi:nitroreductase
MNSTSNKLQIFLLGNFIKGIMISKTIDEFIKGRYSVYPPNFIEGKQIGREIIEKLLENATWAPTHKLTEPWHFIVFHGEGVAKFYDNMIDIYRKTTPPDKFAQKKIDNWNARKSQVSHVIAICMKRDEAKRVPEIEEIAAVAAAAQNIYLSLDSYGIAGYWASGPTCYTPEMKQFLDLGEEDSCLGFFNLGYPKEDLPKPVRRRKPIAEKTRWIG